jgi:hypothetical protein
MDLVDDALDTLLCNAQQAAVEVEEPLFRGHPEVVDADLADYFGTIPHADLLKSVARQIVDRRVLHLIKMWLDCPVPIFLAYQPYPQDTRSHANCQNF